MMFLNGLLLKAVNSLVSETDKEIFFLVIPEVDNNLQLCVLKMYPRFPEIGFLNLKNNFPNLPPSCDLCHKLFIPLGLSFTRSIARL